MKKRDLLKVFILIVASTAIWITGCSDTTREGDSGTGPQIDWNDPQLPARLEQALQGWLKDFGLYGGAAAVLAPGRMEWISSSGEEDIELHTPYLTETKGRIASATKPFTAAVILQLKDEGLLSLDTKLSEFLPDYPNAGEITVEHLLRHRSGIPEVQLVDLLFIGWVLGHPDYWMTPEELLYWTYAPFPPVLPMFSIKTFDWVPREPVTYPGGEYHYSQPGYIALGHIIQEVTGKQLADVYDERIIQPLGLNDTNLPRKDDPADPEGYTNLFGLLENKIPGKSILPSANGLISAALSAGGILSTAGDLVTFLSSLLTGELFSEQAFANMTDWRDQESSQAVPPSQYGMGLYKESGEGYTTIGHDGALPGGGSVMKYIPDFDVYIGAVTNTDRDSAPGAPSLVERVKRALLNEAQDQADDGI